MGRISGVAMLSTALAALAGIGCQRSEKSAPITANPAPTQRTAAQEPVTRAVATQRSRVSFEPCRLLSAEEASSFLRGPAKVTPFDKLTYASSCIWEAKNPRRGLQVMTSTPAQLHADEDMRKLDADTVEKRFAQVVESQIGKPKARPVTGLGDAALWVDEGAQLWILQKDRALVTVSFHDEADATGIYEKSRAVAEKILPRL